MKISSGQIYTLSSNLTLNEDLIIEVGGKLRFDPNKSAKLTIGSAKNLINNSFEGIEMEPANDSIIHEIEMAGINESTFVGGTMEPVSTDPGIWNMGAGTMYIQGAFRKRFTNSVGSVLAGARGVTVKDATGWKVGDEIVINPTTDIPQAHGEGRQWNQTTKTYTDNFVERLERRIITSISGNSVSFADPLKFNHFEYKTTPNKLAPNGRHYTAYIANLTSNVKIHGTKTGKSHIFSCAHSHNPDGSTKHNIQKQYIDQAEIYYMGPRKYQGHRYGILEIVKGRYVMHFHHGGDGTTGTMVSNCAFHDNSARCAVPHMANGITFKGNVIAFNLGEGMWWDVASTTGEMTHNATYDGNLLCGILWDRVLSGSISILFGMGSNNKAINNWTVYGHVGDENGSGAYQWSANDESVWVVIGNGGNSCNSIDWTWQNSGRAHEIEEQQAYCNTFGLSHGAYANPYIYSRNEYYNSPVHLKASASLAMGASFERCVFDGDNKLDWLLNKQISAGGGIEFDQQFRECEFKNARVALRIDNYKANGVHSIPVNIAAINCLFSNIQKKCEFYESASYPNDPQFNPPLDLKVKFQNGNTAEQHNKNGVTSIPKFAPDKYGTGDGLMGVYYKGANFEQKIFERLDSMVRYDQWRVDMPTYPEGVHYKLNVGPFSVRWTGFIEPWATGAWQFRIMGASGFRLWIDNKLVIDSPQNKSYNGDFADSQLINLEGLKKYSIKIECYEPGDVQRGIIFYWKGPLTNGFWDVPMCQMYSGLGVLPPPQVYKSIGMSKDFIRNNCPEGQTGEVYTYRVDAGQFESTISQEAANAKAVLDIQLNGQNQANKFGTCKIIPMPTPCEIFIWTDYLDLQTDLRPAGIDTEQEAINHYNKYGKNEKRRANKLCDDPNLIPAYVPPVPPNILPTVNAGEDIQITLPTNEVRLIGSGSDSDGTIDKWLWVCTSGVNAIIETPNLKDTNVKGLQEGIYVFKLTVTDNKGGTAFDSASVNVKPEIIVPTVEEFTAVSGKVHVLQADGTLKAKEVPKEEDEVKAPD